MKVGGRTKGDKAIEQVIHAVAEEYGIQPEAIHSRSRVHPLPDARKMVCHILADKVAHVRIAARIDRNRSYVIHSREVVLNRIQIYKGTRDKYHNILNKLGYADQA